MGNKRRSRRKRKEVGHKPILQAQAVAIELPAEEPAAEHVDLLVFAAEDFRSTAREAIPLFQAAAEELSLTDLSWTFKPQLNAVAEACDNDRAIWLTARDRAGNLVGGCLYAIGPAPLYRETLMASCEVIYLAPDYRTKGLLSLGAKFLAYCESMAIACGAQIVEHAAMEGTAHHKMLEWAGFSKVATIYWKISQEPKR